MSRRVGGLWSLRITSDSRSLNGSVLIGDGNDILLGRDDIDLLIGGWGPAIEQRDRPAELEAQEAHEAPGAVQDGTAAAADFRAAYWAVFEESGALEAAQLWTLDAEE
jgi:hypothetical protein